MRSRVKQSGLPSMFAIWGRGPFGRRAHMATDTCRCRLPSPTEWDRVGSWCQPCASIKGKLRATSPQHRSNSAHTRPTSTAVGPRSAMCCVLGYVFDNSAEVARSWGRRPPSPQSFRGLPSRRLPGNHRITISGDVARPEIDGVVRRLVLSVACASALQRRLRPQRRRNDLLGARGVEANARRLRAVPRKSPQLLTAEDLRDISGDAPMPVRTDAPRERAEGGRDAISPRRRDAGLRLGPEACRHHLSPQLGDVWGGPLGALSKGVEGRGGPMLLKPKTGTPLANYRGVLASSRPILGRVSAN